MVSGWAHLANPADVTFFFIMGISITLLVLNTGVMLYFVFKYSKKKNPNPEDVKDNLSIEVLWTVVPTILVLAIFWVGWKGFVYMRTAPPDAMPIKVTARQWSWTFTYPNGIQDSVLRVPVRKPIKLLLTSVDVLHSLFIPAYRIKEDCVPGMETHLWFLPDELGSYDLFCTEYCGVEHSAMITKVEVMPEKDFDAWYKKEEARPDVASLLQVKGCLACHTTDGSPKIGPTFKGMFGKKEIVVRNGKERELVVDEAFIKQKILQPELDRVKGFPPIMPSQKGLLTDKELDQIIEYIRALEH